MCLYSVVSCCYLFIPTVHFLLPNVCSVHALLSFCYSLSLIRLNKQLGTLPLWVAAFGSTHLHSQNKAVGNVWLVVRVYLGVYIRHNFMCYLMLHLHYRKQCLDQNYCKCLQWMCTFINFEMVTLKIGTRWVTNHR